MNSTQRRSQLLMILKYETDTITTEDLAKMLYVSKRTIHSDLNVLIAQGHEIVKIPGVGVTLKDEKEGTIQPSIEMDTTQYRRFQILKEMLFQGNTKSYTQLADEYYVSLSSIQLDLKFIKENFLEEHCVELVSNELGTYLQGTETRWQKTYIHFNEYLQQYYNLNYYEKNLRVMLEELYGKHIVEEVFHVVESFSKFNLVSTAQYYLLNIVNVLIVLSFRAQLGKHHLETDHGAYISDKIMSLQYFLIAKDILNMLEERTGISFTDEDIYYVSSYLYGNRITFIASREVLNADIEKIISEFIKEMSICLHADFEKDRQLYNNLRMHIPPMLYRLHQNIYIKNPLLESIQSEFRIMFDVTWLVADSLQKKIGVRITEDEIGFLMLHFQNALDKMKKSKKILVVCPNGIIASSLIANKIRRVLPPLDIIEMASIDEVKRFGVTGIDFIVSTIPMKDMGIPTIVISPFLNENDEKNILRLYKDNVDKMPLPAFDFLKRYVQRDFIFCQKNASNKEEVIKEVCDLLCSQMIVSKDYEEYLLKREKKGGTDIAAGAALPHGPLDKVNKTTIVIWTNKKSIKWMKYQVKVIVFFVVAKKEIKQLRQILEDIFKLIGTKKNVEKIALISDEEKLHEYLTGGIICD